MIQVTLLNKKKIFINADLIEMVEETPDTIITLTTEKKIIVRESVDEIISRVIAYKRRIYNSKMLGADWDEYTN